MPERTQVPSIRSWRRPAAGLRRAIGLWRGRPGGCRQSATAWM